MAIGPDHVSSCERTLPVLQLFRTNQLFIHLLVLVYLAILWAPAYLVSPVELATQGGFIFDWFSSILPDGQSTRITAALVLIWLQGLIMSYLVNQYRMGPQATLFPGLFIAFFYSATPEFYGLSPGVLANMFLVLAIHQLFKIYKQQESAQSIFNVGFLVSMAALTAQGYLVFVFLGWIGIGIMRSRGLLEFFQYAIGLALPWGFLGMIFYILAPGGSYIELVGYTWSWPPFFIGPEGLRIQIQMLLLLLLLLAIISQFGKVSLGETMQVQKNIQVLYWICLLSLVSLFIVPQIDCAHFLLTVIPAGVLLGLWMSRLRPARAEMAHFLLFMAVAIYQYFPLITI